MTDLSEHLGKKRALLISIRHVHHGPSLGNQANLEFAHRDAEALRDMLIASHGYQADDVILMMDDERHPEHLWPTRARILHQIDQLTSDAPENSHFLFSFSGHRLEREADSNDRASMGAGGREGGQWNHSWAHTRTQVTSNIVCADGKRIQDDTLRDRLTTPLKRLKGSKLFTLFDCCHSKTLSDLQGGKAPDHYPRVGEIHPDQMSKGISVKTSKEYRRRRNDVPPAPRQVSFKLRSPPIYETKKVGELDTIHLSARRNEQLADDDCDLGQTFTKCFLNAMAAKPNIAWTEFRDAVEELASEMQTGCTETYPEDPGSENDGTHESLTEVPSHCATLFDYDEPPSPTSSAYLCEDEVPPLDLSRAKSQLSHPPLMTSHPEAPFPKKPGASECISVLKRRFVTRFKKTNRNQASQPPDQPSTQSSQPASFGSTSQSQPKVNTPNEGPSRMVARNRQVVYKLVPPKPENQQGERGGDRNWVTIKVPAWIGRLLRLLKVGRSTIPGD